MKYSTAISLALAPAALAKSVRSRRPEIKRSSHAAGSTHAAPAPEVAVHEAPVHAGVDGVPVVPVVGGVVLLWTNIGGGAQAHVVNEQATVTKTVTVAHDAAPTEYPGVDGVTTTVEPGATGVVAGPGATHTVTVGGPQGLSFFPQELNAAVGDTLIFDFLAQNHTVTQSTFGAPCEPLEGGMNSGFMPNPDNSVDPPPQVAMQVMTDEPLWMYCAQGNHCGQGMVFSINPTLEKTHAQFQANAIEQKGTNPDTAITGGAPAEAPVEDPAEAPEMADPNVVDEPVAAPTVEVAAPTGAVYNGALNGGIVMGVGSMNPDGSCNCVVQCDAAGSAYMLQAGQGSGGYGGVAGAIPMGSVGETAPEVSSVEPVDVASETALNVAPTIEIDTAVPEATEAVAP